MNISDLPTRYQDLWNGTRVASQGPLRLVDVKSLIRGQIRFVSSASYHIISYVWGGSCEGDGMFARLSPFSIDGLHVAAKICNEIGATCIWLDALCINQCNDDNGKREKGREIPNMGTYYANAIQTIVFPSGLGVLSSLIDNPVPRWFTRAWTLQEHQKSRECIFIFSRSMHVFMDVSTLGGPLIHRIGSNYVSILGQHLSWCMMSLTGSVEGTPYKVDRTQWKNVDRESFLLMEHRPDNKCDIVQKAMLRNSTKEEDKVYCLLSLFDIVIDVEYDVGISSVLRRLLVRLPSDDIAKLLVANWYPSDNIPSDLCSLPTFEKTTAALWFHVENVMCKCNYVHGKGVQIKAYTIDRNIAIAKDHGEDYLSNTDNLSDIQTVALKLTPSCPQYAYGVTKYYGNVKLIVVGTYAWSTSVLTGYRCEAGKWVCCLMCVRTTNAYRKVGMCLLDIKECNIQEETLLLG